MKYMTKYEEILLLAIWRVKDNAYGVRIRNKVAEVTGQNLSFGALYVSLDKLVKKGFLTRIKGEPTAERGGRSKNFYQLTDEGLFALQQSRELNSAIWDGIPNLSREV